MGSHLTEALVALGANVVAFVRATSSGRSTTSAIAGRADGRLRRPDRQDLDRPLRARPLLDAPDRPYVFHLGAQAHVGESWHRPYETVMANTVGTLNLLQSIVDLDVELEKFDTAGTSEEYGNVREAVAHHHDFDDAGSLILHERSPINPKSIYATAKVAADFLTMNYHDAYGVPGVVTRMFNNYGPRQNPRYVTGTIITQALSRPEIELGALEPLRDFCFCTDGVRGHLTVAAQGVPGDVYVYGQGENISMADWCRPDPPRRRRARLLARRPPRRDRRPAASSGRDRRDGIARRLREAARGDRLGAEGLVGGRRAAHDPVVCGASRPLARTRRLADTPPRRDAMSASSSPAAGVSSARISSSGSRPKDDDVFVARSRDYDLTHFDDAERLFADSQPELVFHLAAEVGGIGANRANPGRYWYANLMMGAHVLELARTHAVRKLVIAGTVCAYPKFTPVPFSEDELWNGYPEETNAPYGVAKKSILVGANAYRDQYGLDAIFLLPANLYGPRDNFDLDSSHVIPALIRKMLEAEGEVTLWGDGSPTREFLFVEDCADALLLAAERYDGPEPVNLGTGVETSIRAVAETIAELTGFDGELVWDTSMPNGQPRRSLDATRARELFGFEARTSLRNGLERTIAWYRSSAAVNA